MKSNLSNHWTELSHVIGFGTGFLIFYLAHTLGYGWEWSFSMAFTMGFFTSTLSSYNLSQRFGREEAGNLSRAIENFEKRERS
tara:strand:+ start:856 stop:1104 length:249 start_codon:yes stop_codon:yes gene_type:complete